MRLNIHFNNLYTSMANTVFHIEGGIGKNIAATAMIAAYKKAKPKRKIVVVSAWPEIFVNNPDIDRFYRIGNTPYFYRDVIFNKDVEIYCQDPYRQTEHITKKKHLIETWCNMVGVKYTDEPVSLHYNFREVEEAKSMAAQFNDPAKPLLIFQPFGGPGKDHQPSPYAWTRDLHPQHAQEIVNVLKDKYNIVHVCYDFHPQLENCHRFDAIIGKKPLFALMSFSEKRLLIDSSLQHAAAALGLPSVVLWVATQPGTFGYPIHNNITPTKTFPEGTIDSYLFDYQFTGQIHECPYDQATEIHSIDNIIKAVDG